MTIQAAEVFAMVPPAIPGLGASGGLQLQLEDRRNLGPTEMQQAINALLASYPVSYTHLVLSVLSNPASCGKLR